MNDKLNEIITILSNLSESIKPNIGIALLGIVAPAVSSFIAILIAHWLDNKRESKREDDDLLSNINYLLVKSDLNIRTLFSIVEKAENMKVNEDKAGSFVTFPKFKVFSPLLELDIKEMKLIDIDNIVTTLIFEFRELNSILQDTILAFNNHTEFILNLSRKDKITVSHFKQFNFYLSEIITSANAFIIRLVVLNTQLLLRAYENLNHHDREKLYEIEITEKLIKFIEVKIDHPDIKPKYDLINSLKSRGEIEDSYKGMEKKDTLIRIFLEIIESKTLTKAST